MDVPRRASIQPLYTLWSVSKVEAIAPSVIVQALAAASHECGPVGKPNGTEVRKR